ncbi:unnamed protein product [Durusdinium trenchii]|uniref:Uncharacterized protein n=2 Tax=Durusdinium trenchii TaxID=1381693 RepID=A0ABP0HPB9_9DINO
MAHVTKWTAADVADWLEQCLQLPCGDAFREADIDGVKLLRLDADQLSKLGSGADHITRLQTHISAFRAQLGKHGPAVFSVESTRSRFSAQETTQDAGDSWKPVGQRRTQSAGAESGSRQHRSSTGTPRLGKGHTSRLWVETRKQDSPCRAKELREFFQQARQLEEEALASLAKRRGLCSADSVVKRRAQSASHPGVQGQSPGSCPKPRIEVNRPRPGSRTPSCGRASPAGSKTQKAVAAEWREMLARPFDRMPRFVPLRQEIGSRLGSRASPTQPPPQEKTPIPQAFQTGFPQNFKSLKEDKSLQEPKQKNFESLEGSKARRTDKQSVREEHVFSVLEEMSQGLDGSEMQASQDEIEEAWRRPVSEFPTMSVTDSAATTHAAQEEALGTATTQTPTSFSGTCSPSKVSNSLQEPTEKKVEGGGKSSERIVEEGMVVDL